ncbi:hypothetical protein C0Q70_02669 [Pomacea canaliculata]|uniref:Uncharacterized protein n=1 Tax=Pomacea canaliculata TaxID=400727 RepID=A0A2T7PQK0_POMCA|nr:hypothetical protein C0Q70_02669 [Pomacea canaliculata]
MDRLHTEVWCLKVRRMQNVARKNMYIVASESLPRHVTAERPLASRRQSLSASRLPISPFPAATSENCISYSPHLTWTSPRGTFFHVEDLHQDLATDKVCIKLRPDMAGENRGTAPS